MEPEFRLMIVLGLQYVFSSLEFVHACVCVSGRENEILGPSGYWLSRNDGGDDGGEGGGWPTYFLLIMPHTPTLAWLPFTHMITHHRRRITAFFAYSYSASFALVFTLRILFYLLLPHLCLFLIALKGAFPFNMSWH